jgi:hypothetical protein
MNRIGQFMSADSIRQLYQEERAATTEVTKYGRTTKLTAEGEAKRLYSEVLQHLAERAGDAKDPYARVTVDHGRGRSEIFEHAAKFTLPLWLSARPEIEAISRMLAEHLEKGQFEVLHLSDRHVPEQPATTHWDSAEGAYDEITVVVRDPNWGVDAG